MEAKQLSGCTALRHLVVFPLFKQFRANPHLLHLRLGSSRRIFAQPLILLQHNLPQPPPPRSHGEMSTCSVGVEGRPGTHMLCALWPSYIPGTGGQRVGDEVPGAEGQTNVSSAIAS